MDATAEQPDSHKSLHEVFHGLRKELQQVIDDSADWVDEDLLAEVRAAWREVEPLFDLAIASLTPDQFPRGQLYENGLAGAQLALKVTLFQRALERLARAKSRYARLRNWSRRTPRRVRRWIARWSGLSRALGAFFGIANVILKSLSFVPGAEAISEFKESIEKVLGAA